MNNSTNKHDDVEIESESSNDSAELTPKQITAEAERLHALNADIEKKLGKFLKPDFKPDGAPANDLKEKVLEAEDKRQQDEMAAELDGKLTEIFAHISDLKSQD